MENKVDLLYYGNDGDYDGILFSVLSAMRKTARALDVTVFTALLNYHDGKPVERGKALYLKGLLRARKDGSDLTLVDMSDPLRRMIRKSGYDLRRRSPYALLPLLIDRSDLKGRVLCLAPETLFPGDVGRAFDLPLDGRCAGAVRDSLMSFLLDPECAETSVMLIDTDRARAQGFFESARRAVIAGEDPEAALCRADAIRFLPRRFNERGALRGDTVIKSYLPRMRFFPYPHRVFPDARGGYGMSKSEYRHFERVYEEYLLQREGKVL